MEKYVVELTKNQLARIVSMCVATESCSDDINEEKQKTIREIAYICLKANKEFAGKDIAEVYVTFLRFGKAMNKFRNDKAREILEKWNEKKS